MSLPGGIFKAYDIRGQYPEELDESVAHRIGAAFAEWSKSDRIVLGRDCRLSSPSLAAAFAAGVNSRGVDVLDAGLASTDLLYFASGRLDVPGAMLTASHNPPDFNGIKLCLARAAPVGEETGLAKVRSLSESDTYPPASREGLVRRVDLLDEYVTHVLGFVSADDIGPLVVVADTANGMGGLVVPAVFSRLPGVKLIHLFPELDGSFPNHPADPIDPENQRDLVKAAADAGADIGLAFDGDADRVFVVDENANGISGSLITALVGQAMLAKNPGSAVVHNVICSRMVPEVIRENGGTPVRTRVGHSFIKKVMADTGAVFGGEHSGHYYFRDHFRADSGLIAALIVLEVVSRAGKPLSELLAPYRRYFDSGEINSRVADQSGIIERLASLHEDGKQDRLDGLTVEYPDWWFNVRPSNTEPLLRLNVEADTNELLEKETRGLLDVIREGAN